MDAPRTTAFGPARIVALALISRRCARPRLSPLRHRQQLGLGAFRHGHRPAGAPPVPATRPRTAATAPTAARSSCARTGTTAHSRLIALPVTRILARSARPGAPVFRLEGGPGLTNMNFPDASRFAGHHDVVLVGYRGVDGSSKLDCPEVISAREHARDFLSEQSYRADAAAFRACAHRLQQQRRRPRPATRFPNASTTSTRLAGRSATSASTCSARARGRARR